LVRYADDIVVGFEHKADAERFWSDLKERMARFALALHPDKTRLIEFGRFAAANRERRGLGKPESFNFLGFTHICGRTRRGRFLLRRRSRRDRMGLRGQGYGDRIRIAQFRSLPPPPPAGPRDDLDRFVSPAPPATPRDGSVVESALRDFQLSSLP